jgi:hypothetical protein
LLFQNVSGIDNAQKACAQSAHPFFSQLS